MESLSKQNKLYIYIYTVNSHTQYMGSDTATILSVWNNSVQFDLKIYTFPFDIHRKTANKIWVPIKQWVPFTGQVWLHDLRNKGRSQLDTIRNSHSLSGLPLTPQFLLPVFKRQSHLLIAMVAQRKKYSLILKWSVVQWSEQNSGEAAAAAAERLTTECRAHVDALHSAYCFPIHLYLEI